MKENEKELTPKQRKFAEEYCIDLNATAAYIRAGYKARGHAAESNASRLLSNAEIQKAIAKKQKELASKCDVTAERVIREVAALAVSDVRKLFNVDGTLKKIHELDDLTAASIASIEVDEIKAGETVIGHVKKIKVWRRKSPECFSRWPFGSESKVMPTVPRDLMRSMRAASSPTISICNLALVFSLLNPERTIHDVIPSHLKDSAGRCAIGQG